MASDSYFVRHGFCPPRIARPPAPGLGMVVVIPALAEPELTTTLASLRSAQAPPCPVEVIVVINAPEDAPEDVRRANARAMAGARRWIAAHECGALRFHLLDFPALPKKHAGVGLARKIGMDEAAARLEAAGNARGIIAGLDADCTCAPGYLRALQRHFARNADSPACSIYFEHDIAAVGDPRLREGIVHYELFLRYYNLGLKFAGHPFAFHTLGSSMAVRADAYQAQGGMNRRKAAEDFYFLGKFMALGNFSEIRDTVVYPSARASGRVPFGTGRAMGQWLEGAGSLRHAYHPRIFMELAQFLGRAEQLHEFSEGDLKRFLARLPPGMAAFLSQARFVEKWREMRANSAAPHTFMQRFYRWFDRFRVLKYVHFADARRRPRPLLTRAFADLLAWQGLCQPEAASRADASALLHHARRMERQGKPLPFLPGTRG